MSDTSIPTAPADSGAPPPQQTEVTIPETGPSGGSGETGAQSPSRAHEVMQWERAAERSSAIERAFERSRKAQADKGESSESSESRESRPKAETKSDEKPARQPPTKGA